MFGSLLHFPSIKALKAPEEFSWGWAPPHAECCSSDVSGAEISPDRQKSPSSCRSHMHTERQRALRRAHACWTPCKSEFREECELSWHTRSRQLKLEPVEGGGGNHARHFQWIATRWDWAKGGSLSLWELVGIYSNNLNEGGMTESARLPSFHTPLIVELHQPLRFFPPPPYSVSFLQQIQTPLSSWVLKNTNHAGWSDWSLIDWQITCLCILSAACLLPRLWLTGNLR